MKETKHKWEMDKPTRENIKRLFREHVELQTVDETPETTTYVILYNEKEAGYLICTINKEVQDAIEILDIKINPEFNGMYMKIIDDVLSKIWKEYPNHNKIFVSPEPESKNFWGKMGATRLNDKYMMILRGH